MKILKRMVLNSYKNLYELSNNEVHRRQNVIELMYVSDKEMFRNIDIPH